MRKHIKQTVAVLGTLAIASSQVAYGATYYGNYSSANMWTDVFYSEQTRLYGDSTFTYGHTYTAWPGAKSDHHNGIMAALSYENTWDVAQVFGEDCLDLNFNSIETTTNYKNYFIDADRLLSPNDTAQWNGFLFAVASGPKADISSKTVYFEYGSSETVTEDVVERRADGTNGATGNDCYLYVFDIKDGKNYGEALVAKWDIKDIVGADKNPYAIFESVTVNDDYICLTLNNNVIGENTEYSYDRGLVVLKNNIKRDGSVLSPVRVDIQDETYRYGAKPIVEASLKSGVNNSATYDSTIIGDYYILFPTVATDMVTKGDKTIIGEEKIVMVNLSDIGKTGEFEKLSVVVSPMYKEDKRTIGVSLDEILPLGGKSWHDIDSAKIRGIQVCGTEINFLVTYQETANGKTTYYKHIFATDWSNPLEPKAIGDFKYIDTQNTAQAGAYGINDDLFYYEGYYYIPNNYGVDVIKKYDENGNFSPEFITTHFYVTSDETKSWNTDKKVDVFVTGNYMLAWNDYNGNVGYEIRLKLSDDKSEIVEFCGYGTRNRCRAINDVNDIIQYKDRIYLMSTGNIYATMGPCINVLDVSRAMPMGVTIDSIPKNVSLPYTASGNSIGLSKVAIYIDGEFCNYVDSTKQTDGTYKWEYALTKAGSHSIKAVGVPFADTEIPETAEYAEYTGISAKEIRISGTYTTDGDKLGTSISVTNSGDLDIGGRVVVGIYKDDILYSLGISDMVTVKSGVSKIVDNIDTTLPSYLNGYTVKAFLTSGSEGFAPLTSAAELTAN